MVQAAHYRYRGDLSGALRWDESQNVVRSPLPDALVRSGHDITRP